MKILPESEYVEFKADTKSYSFDKNKFWTTMIPDLSKHLLDHRNYNKLVYEFYIKLTDVPKSPLGITIDMILGPDEVFFDGKLIGKTGDLETSNYTYDKVRIYSISDKLLERGRLHRITVVSNVSTSIVRGTITGNMVRIGYLENELNALTKRDIFAVAIAGVYLIMGIYYGLFFLKRRNDRE